MNVSNKYLLADYMNDRQKAATGTTLAGTSTVKTPVGIAASPAVKAPTVTAPKTITQPAATAPSSAGAASAGSTATGAVVNADEVVTKSQFTTADVDAKMQSVLQEIMDFGSRKFQYNAKESPLYTILEQQAAKEARLASGRAYSMAAANTGGFGSSYAGLAAEEASRQVMAGLDDQQLAMYQAAKEEFDSQYQSKLQQYDALKTIYGDLNAKEAKEAEQATTESGMTAGASDAYNYVLSLGETGWNGANEEAIRTMLNNQAIAGGWTSDDVEKAISMLKAGDAANVADTVKNLSANPTMSGAAEAYLAAKQNGTLDQYAAEISKSARTALEHEIDAEGADAQAVLMKGAQAVKDGYLSTSDYVGIVTADVHADIKDMESSGKKITERQKRKRVAQNIEGIIDMYDSGMLSGEAYQQALAEMKPYLDKYFALPDGYRAEAMTAKSYDAMFNLSSGEGQAIYEAAMATLQTKDRRGGR